MLIFCAMYILCNLSYIMSSLHTLWLPPSRWERGLVATLPLQDMLGCALLGLELLLLAGLAILCFLKVEPGLQNMINQELIVKPGGALFDIWAEPPIQPIFKVNLRLFTLCLDIPFMPGVCVQCD